MKKLLLAVCLVFASATHAEERSFNETAVLIDGTKFWLPSTIVVKKGDVVKLHLVSKVPGKPQDNTHGFAIDAFKVEEVVDSKGKDVSFTADKAGIFPVRCQMHPGHIGGQLIVLE